MISMKITSHTGLLSIRRMMRQLKMKMLIFFFFNDTATTEIYTLSLHDALPICTSNGLAMSPLVEGGDVVEALGERVLGDRKSTRLNSSHSQISYAVFCLKKKKTKESIEAMTTKIVTFLICAVNRITSIHIYLSI